MSRAVLQVFEHYQAARTTFVQTIAELAHRPQNVEALQNADVMVREEKEKMQMSEWIDGNAWMRDVGICVCIFIFV